MYINLDFLKSIYCMMKSKSSDFKENFTIMTIIKISVVY